MESKADNLKLEKSIGLLSEIVDSELAREESRQSPEVQSKIIGSMFFLPPERAIELLSRFVCDPTSPDRPGSKVGMSSYAQDMIELIKLSKSKKSNSSR